MAENGYVTVSMDMSKPYIWKYGDNDDDEKSIPVANDHVESLLKANKGDNPGYPVDLKDKIDFEKIGLIGHSRGGETIFDIAMDQKNREIDIKAILSVAPTMLFEKKWPDTNVAILVPEYDGDVIQLDGFNMYRILNSEGQKNRNHYVTLLKGANHNYFNRNIQINDALMRSTEDISDQLTREQQESFLMDYAVGFFDSSFRGNNEHFINIHNPQPDKMYGLDVKSMFRSEQAVDLVDVDTTDDFIAEGAIIEATTDSWFYKDDKILIDTITSGLEPYNLRALINIKWEKSDSRVIISPRVQDFSKFTSLTLNMVIDSADELNQPNNSQRFTIGLRDVDGNFSKIVLPEGLNALDYTSGKIDSTQVFEETLYYWSVASPISAINLPLNEFKDVNLKRIESIEMIFDQTDSGSVYIDSILLQ
ncbi:Alpha/beta hydrolase family protein [compost metagenome]